MFSTKSSVRDDVKAMEISAVKILADGTKVPLGTICTWHRNPLINLWRNLKLKLGMKGIKNAS
jgi:hypothetical protein